MNVPAIVRNVPEGAPHVLKVPAFEIRLPAEYDPAVLDQFGLELTVRVSGGAPVWDLTAIRDPDTKEPTGGVYLRAPRWLYKCELLPGTQAVTDYAPAPEQLRLGEAE